MTAVPPAAMMSGRYQRAFTIAVVLLVAGWHLAGAGGQLLHNRAAYGSFAFQVVMWLVMALAITAGSVLVLRGYAAAAHPLRPDASPRPARPQRW